MMLPKQVLRLFPNRNHISGKVKHKFRFHKSPKSMSKEGNEYSSPTRNSEGYCNPEDFCIYTIINGKQKKYRKKKSCKEHFKLERQEVIQCLRRRKKKVLKQGGCHNNKKTFDRIN